MARLVNDRALSFRDILLVPQYNEIKSRLDTDLTTRLSRNIKIKHPIISTNMSTVTHENMMNAMCNTGSVGILHRFMDHKEIIRIIESSKVSPLVISIGVKEDDYVLVNKILECQNMPDAILIDIAHGDSYCAYKMLKYVKQHFNGDVIFGNLATKDAVKRAINNGADAVRIGVGGGGVCTTRNQTGSGVPTLQSIKDAFDVTQESDKGIVIIGDGGFTHPGEIVKSLAFGAECVTLGSMLAGTSASPGETFIVDGKKKKILFGMSSKTAQDLLKGGIKKGIASEGMDKTIDYIGDTEEVVENICAAIRSGLTYSGAKNIQELQENSEYVIISAGGMLESKFFM